MTLLLLAALALPVRADASLTARLSESCAFQTLRRWSGGGPGAQALPDGGAAPERAVASLPDVAGAPEPPPPGPAAALTAAVREALDAFLSPARVSAYLAQAADPRLEGRGTGTPQGAAYARFLQEHLRQAGFDVSAQPFEVHPLRDFGFGGRRMGALLKKAEGTNVVARIEGADPAVARQTVVLSAHFDHLLPTRDLPRWLLPLLLIPFAPGLPLTAAIGPVAEVALEFTVPIVLARDLAVDLITGRWLPAPGRRKVFPGADDNGSGVSALLSVADAFAELGRRGTHPRRTIVIAFMDAEEEGLIGSKRFVERLAPEERDAIVQVINLDMVGWNDPRHPNRLEVLVPPVVPLWMQWFVDDVLPVEKGEALMDRHNPVLRDKLEALNASLGLGLDLYYNNREANASDQYRFFAMKRPDGRRTSVLMLYDGGHGPYHQEGDAIAGVDAAYASKAARLAAALAWDVANTDTVPEYHE